MQVNPSQWFISTVMIKPKCYFYTETLPQAGKTASVRKENPLKNAKFSIRRLYRYNPNTQTHKA